jgi:hypothetical protein
MNPKLKQFLIYHLRWQSGFFVAMPSMWFFQDKLHWPLWAAIIGFQFVGALIYYSIDKLIFKK